MRFSEREEQKLQRLAADRGMPRGADCVMAEGTLEGRGIAIRTNQGVVWIPEGWRVTMAGRWFALGWDSVRRIIGYADAGSDYSLARSDGPRGTRSIELRPEGPTC